MRAAFGGESVGVAILFPVIQESEGDTAASTPVTDSEATATGDAEPTGETPELTDEEKQTLADQAQPMASGELNYTINTLIMFLCAVLVLFMQAGFAMVEVGLNPAQKHGQHSVQEPDGPVHRRRAVPVHRLRADVSGH